MQRLQKSVVLQTLDSHWRDHLAAMDYLRQGIHLRGYAQKNPAQEFKRESFNMFTSMLSGIKYEVVSTLSKIQPQDESQMMLAPQTVTHLNFQHAEISTLTSGPAAAEVEPAETTMAPMQTIIRQEPKVGRNDPCPCGSGKKYKQCHGQL